MLTRIIKASAGALALVALLSAVASAQTTQIEGTVKVKGADGVLKPVAGALIDIYRLDIKGHWDVKTDKNGHYIRLGLPVQGNYLFVATGPGIQPTYSNNIRISQVPTVDLEAVPGDGAQLSPEQLQSLMSGKNPPNTVTKPAGGGASAADRAKADAAAKEAEAKMKEGKALQDSYDQARAHYNTAVEMMHANNYSGALTELDQVSNVDISKHAAFAELSYKANANAAEAHYQLGVDLFNKKNRPESKPHFEQAVSSAKKAIALASSAPTEGNANMNNDLVVYYNILTKNAQLLVEYFGSADLVDPTAQAIDKAEVLDAANKNKWEVARGNLYRAAGRTDEAVTSYKKVLESEPGNLDALYNIGLALLGSPEKEKIQESVNALADFVAKAPATDKRVPDAKATIEAIRGQFKIEAEKPAKRAKGKP